MHGFRKHDSHLCPCGKPAVGRLNNCPCCESCARIEKNLSEWADGATVKRRAIEAESMTIDEFKSRFDAWCKRRNINWKNEREDWRNEWKYGSNY